MHSFSPFYEQLVCFRTFVLTCLRFDDQIPWIWPLPEPPKTLMPEPMKLPQLPFKYFFIFLQIFLLPSSIFLKIQAIMRKKLVGKGKFNPFPKNILGLCVAWIDRVYKYTEYCIGVISPNYFSWRVALIRNWLFQKSPYQKTPRSPHSYSIQGESEQFGNWPNWNLAGVF